MSSKDFNEIAAIEKAISQKYGNEAIQNPRANWDENKEKEYLAQMKELYNKIKSNDEAQDKIDINGIKVSKKLFNKSFVNKKIEVLFDRCGRHENQYIGRSIYNQSVFTSSTDNLVGTIHEVPIIHSTNFALEAKL